MVAARPAGRWATLLSAAARRRLAAMIVSPTLAVLGVLAVPAVQAEAYGCSYSFHDTQITVNDPNGTFTLNGLEFAGHYSGETVIPLTNGVSASGIEAQCLLRRAGYNPGTIDGIFGPNSQSAARALQSFVNNNFHAGISVDGLPGPQTWPWIRHLAQ